jgi:Mg2+-importing ATPase
LGTRRRAIGAVAPCTLAGDELGLVPLPGLYWPLVAVMMLAYAALTHLVKRWFVRRFGM